MNAFIRRLLIDLVLVILLVHAVADRFTENTVHEVLSLVLLGAACVHLWENRKWFVTAFTRPTLQDAVRGAVAAGLTVAFMTAIVTGIMTSQALFADILPPWMTGHLTERLWHVTSTLWTLVLSGVHLGLHYRQICGWWLKKCTGWGLPKIPLWQKVFWSIVFTGFSVRAWIERDMWYCLAGEMTYLEWAKTDNAASMLIDYTSVVLIAAGVTILLMKTAKKTAELLKKSAA